MSWKQKQFGPLLPRPRCYPTQAPGWWRSWTRAASSWGHRSLRRMIKLTMLGTLRPILRDCDHQTSVVSRSSDTDIVSVRLFICIPRRYCIYTTVCTSHADYLSVWWGLVIDCMKTLLFFLLHKQEHALLWAYVCSRFQMIHMGPHVINCATLRGRVAHTTVTTSACRQTSPVVNSVEIEPLSFPFLTPLTDTS